MLISVLLALREMLSSPLKTSHLSNLILDERMVSAPSVLAVNHSLVSNKITFLAWNDLQLSTKLPVLLTRIRENSTLWEYMIDMVLCA